MKLTGFVHEGPDGELDDKPCEYCHHWGKVHPDDADKRCLSEISSKSMRETQAGDTCAFVGV